MPSSVVRSFSYDPGTHRLRVVFVSGLVYDYKKVPQDVYQEMKTSFSKGGYLNEHIKGHYSFEKIR